MPFPHAPHCRAYPHHSRPHYALWVRIEGRRRGRDGDRRDSERERERKKEKGTEGGRGTPRES
eukprot:643610-Amorphochlora_amoeboformis.AAC.1